MRRRTRTPFPTAPAITGRAHPRPPPPPPTAATAAVYPPGTQVIGLGEEVKDRLVDQDKHYVVTARSNGTLAVRLTLPPQWQDSGAMVLRLKLNGTNFPSGCCAWDYPVVAHMTVVTGQQVLVAVSNAGGYWDYRQVGSRAEEGLPFVLTTALE